MAGGKADGRLLLQIEPAKNGVDFSAYLYSPEGVVRVATFPFRDGWTVADRDEMMIEAVAIVKKNRKKFAIKPPKDEEPS